MTDPNTFAPYNITVDVPCGLFDGDQGKCNVLDCIHRVFGSLSLAACVFIWFIQWLYRRYTVFVQRLILYLTVVAAIDCVVTIVGGKALDNHNLCIFQAWVSQFASLSTLIWVCCITLDLFMNAILESSTEKLEWFYHAVAWVIPFLVSMFPLIGHTYGPAGAWCWLINSWQWRFGIWYCPFFVVVSVLIGVYTFIIYKINVKTKLYLGHFDPQTEHKRLVLMAQVIPLRIYPLIYLLCGVFPLIDRVHNAATNDAIFGLKIMHAIFSPLQGALFALGFCLDRDTIDQLHWTRLKLAFHHRWSRTNSIIREYPIEGASVGDDPRLESSNSYI